MPIRQTLLLECSYLGQYFHGVQFQKDKRTVAGELSHQLITALGAPPRGLTFAARTDAGVSARQNFATCWYRGNPLSDQALARLTQPNASALQVTRVQLVPRALNARSSSRSKHYQYRIRTSVPPSLIAQNSCKDTWCIAPSLSAEPMQRAAQLLTGTHDFSAFRASNCEAKNPIKTLLSMKVTSMKVTGQQEQVVIDVEGTAFLRKMVRILVGTLVEVGAGLRRVESIPALFQSKDRKQAGLAVPARGLWLMSVALLWPEMRHPGMPLLRL